MNDLASRYLKTDFARDASSFDEQVRLALAEEKRYFGAIKKADALYAESLDESSKWLTATRDQREAEIARLKREVASLESTRANVLKDIERLTRSKLRANPDSSGEKRERLYALRHRLDDLDGEIAKKRQQADYLSNPDSNRKMETRAASEKQHLQYLASDRREKSLRDIDRHMKPKRMVVDIVTEYEKKTVGALQKTMAEESTKRQKQVETLGAEVKQLTESKLLVPVSDMAELQRLRKTLQN